MNLKSAIGYDRCKIRNCECNGDALIPKGLSEEKLVEIIKGYSQSLQKRIVIVKPEELAHSIALAYAKIEQKRKERIEGLDKLLDTFLIPCMRDSERIAVKQTIKDYLK